MNKCSKCGAPIFCDEPLLEPQWCLDCIMEDNRPTHLDDDVEEGFDAGEWNNLAIEDDPGM